jgi:photosystem II stability/assembly factor-like uncharacterized protein
MKKYYSAGNRLIVVLVFLLILLGKNSYSQQYWQNISNPTTRDLLKCSFPDTLNGWAIGDSGTILHTSNGGYNWVLQNSKLRGYMVAVYFLNARLGWALSWVLGPEYYGTYILKTTNGGNTWDTTCYSVPDSYIRTIYFQDSLYGFMGGNPAILLRTTNGGAKWEKCEVDTTAVVYGFPINKFRFFSNNYGMACGGIMDIAGVIWTTTNRGLYWNVKTIAPEPINDLKFFDSLNILAIAGDFEYGTSVLRTSNGGLDWSYTNIGVFGIPYTMAWRTNSEAWCPMGYINSFLLTSNYGNNWAQIETPDSTKLFDLTFLNSRFGIGVGLGGAIVRYNPNVTFTISGTARYNDNNQPLSSGKVKAFKLNRSTGGVSYVDSAVIQADGTYTLTHIPQDSVDIGVFPNLAPPNDWVITYYPSTINWQNASVIYPAGNLNNIDINVFRLVSTTANNSVNGKVMQSIASPLLAGIKDVFVYVKNGNTFVRTGITDSLGIYHVQSLPSGNLKVIVNRLGYSGDSSMVTVTPTSNVDSVNFYLNRIYIGINPVGNNIPSDFKLYQNYPNPFNPTTNIKYQIPKNGFVSLKVYDLLGREIVTLVNEYQKAGTYETQFSINSITNHQLSSGIYFYRLLSGDFVETKKMLMIK